LVIFIKLVPRCHGLSRSQTLACSPASIHSRACYLRCTLILHEPMIELLGKGVSNDAAAIVAAVDCE
jgi:hypothetical protein